MVDRNISALRYATNSWKAKEKCLLWWKLRNRLVKSLVIMTSSLRHKHYVILERLSVHNQISIINCQVHGIPQDRCLCRGKNKSRISFILFLNEKSILILDQGTNDEIISYQERGFQLVWKVDFYFSTSESFWELYSWFFWS